MINVNIFLEFFLHFSLVLQQKTQTGINKPCKFNIYKEFFLSNFYLFLVVRVVLWYNLFGDEMCF